MVALGATLAPARGPAFAEEFRPAPAVPLADEFSPFEITTAIGVAAAGIVVLGFGASVFGTPSPSMGLAAADSFDGRIARELAGDTTEPFLGGVPDIVGIAVLPVVPALFYGAESFAVLRNGRPWLTNDHNPHHRLLAYTEALGWTVLITGVTKYVIGRPRPYTDPSFGNPALRHRESEDNLSFFSGHASISFAAGAFVTADLSRALKRGALANASAMSRFWLGDFVPGLVGYGLPGVVALSRVIDQQHWPSDVLIGAATGILIGRLAYDAHFDAEGQPRGRHWWAREHQLALSPLLGTGMAKMTGLGVSGRF
jgi:membrane-associated phospholipid phosphatase